MRDPYRSVQDRGDGVASSPEPEDLGAFKSAHARAGVIAIARASPFTVHLHEDGLVVRGETRGGREPRGEIPFTEIDALYFDFESFFTDAPPRVTIVGFDGARTVIPNDLERLDLLLGALDRRVTDPISREARAALARGERLTFGPVSVELDGIRLDEESVCWSDLAEVVAERETLVFYAREPRGRFGWTRLRDLPHPRALLEVLGMRTDIVLDGLDPRVSPRLPSR